jgi:putative spermidine/putrescine transport system ATP-binding protein
VADFIGTMNRLPGAVRGGVFESRAGRLPWPGAAPDGPAEILFRPEAVSIAGGDAGGLRGTVAAAMFLGDRTRLFVDVGEAQPLVVESAARREFRRGETLALRVDPAGVLVLPGG